VAEYSLGIKKSAQKELDALGNALFARVDRKILALAKDPRPAGCRKLKGFKIFGESESVITESSIALMTRKKSLQSHMLHTVATSTIECVPGKHFDPVPLKR